MNLMVVKEENGYKDFPAFDALRNVLSKIRSESEREEYLKKGFFQLYCNALKDMGRYEEYYYESVDNYTFYILDYLQPKLEELRRNGKLKKGKKQIAENLEYEGELDENNKACGQGVLRRIDYKPVTKWETNVQYTGTFINDCKEGIGTENDLLLFDFVRTGEFRSDKKHGKATFWLTRGDHSATNQTFNNGDTLACKVLVNKEEE